MASDEEKDAATTAEAQAATPEPPASQAAPVPSGTAATGTTDDLYTKDEIMAAAQAFGTTPYVVAGALRRVSKDKLTRAEAEAAIKDFLEREV